MGIWPFYQPGRASEHARTAAPFTGATAHCVTREISTDLALPNMSGERSVSRQSESRGGSVFEETIGRENKRVRMSLLAPFSAHVKSSARHKVTTGTRQRTQAGPGVPPGSDASPPSASLLIAHTCR